MGLAEQLERGVREHLDEGECLESAFEAIRSHWAPVTGPGALFTQPCAVALTDRRLLVFEVHRFTNTLQTLALAAPRLEVGATFKPGGFWSWKVLEGSWSRLRLLFPHKTIRLYVDRASRNEAAGLAEILSGPQPRSP